MRKLEVCQKHLLNESYKTGYHKKLWILNIHFVKRRADLGRRMVIWYAENSQTAEIVDQGLYKMTLGANLWNYIKTLL